MTVSLAPDLGPRLAAARRPVRRLVVLGDSTAVGLGDPVPGGGWRGFPKLLRDALAAAPGATTLSNHSRNGARMASVRHQQLAGAVAALPDAAVICVGMNDTLRSNYDPDQVRRDGTACVEALRAVGAHVLLLRYHDHTRVFRMPAPLQRALRRRIDSLNAAIDAVAAAYPDGVGVLDLHLLPGGYDPAAWSVDRLHPSELGHRLLATGMAALLDGAGFAVPNPVSLRCAGGREVTTAQRVAWLVIKGVPWLVRRSSDLAPVIVQAMVSELRGRRALER